MSFPNKEQRAVCWAARDHYWECLDKHERAKSDASQAMTACEEFRKVYEQGCPPQWVKHFDRRRTYLQFKDKIEKHGYEPLDYK